MARSCCRWRSSKSNRAFATCSHFLSAAVRVGERSAQSETSGACFDTARSFGLNAHASAATIGLFANYGKGARATPSSILDYMAMTDLTRLPTDRCGDFAVLARSQGEWHNTANICSDAM
jgi:hypothetical protein